VRRISSCEHCLFTFDNVDSSIVGETYQYSIRCAIIYDVGVINMMEIERSTVGAANGKTDAEEMKVEKHFSKARHGPDPEISELLISSFLKLCEDFYPSCCFLNARST